MKNPPRWRMCHDTLGVDVPQATKQALAYYTRTSRSPSLLELGLPHAYLARACLPRDCAPAHITSEHGTAAWPVTSCSNTVVAVASHRRNAPLQLRMTVSCCMLCCASCRLARVSTKRLRVSFWICGPAGSRRSWPSCTSTRASRKRRATSRSSCCTTCARRSRQTCRPSSG